MKYVRFQLSTLLACSLFCAVFLGVQFIPNETKWKRRRDLEVRKQPSPDYFGGVSFEDLMYPLYEHGFPFCAYSSGDDFFYGRTSRSRGFMWHYKGLAANAAIGIGLMFALGFVCEWRLRRTQKI